MAVGAFTFYNAGRLNTINGAIDFDTDEIRCILLYQNITPAIYPMATGVTSHSTYADVSAYEVGTAGGYATGGVILTTKTITDATGTVKVDCADISFGTSVSIKAKYAVFVHSPVTGVPVAGDLLLGIVDLNNTDATAASFVESVASDFVVRTGVSGLYQAA